MKKPELKFKSIKIRFLKKNKILLFLLMSTNLLCQNKILTLRECIELGLKNNIELKQKKNDISIAEVNRKEAKGLFFPTFNSNVRNSWNNGLTQNVNSGILERLTDRNSTINISGNITLFNGFLNNEILKLRESEKSYSEYNFEDSKNKLKISILTYYLEILENKERIKILENQYQSSLLDIELYEKMISRGVKAKADLLELKLDLANLKEKQMEVYYDLLFSKEKLIEIICVNNNFKYDFDDVFNLKSYQEIEIQKILKTKQNSIRMSESNLEISKKNYLISKRKASPTLSLFTNFNTRESEFLNRNFYEQIRTNFGLTYGLEIQIPILNQFKNNSEIKRGKINVINAENDLELTKNRYVSMVRESFLNLKLSEEIFSLSKEKLEVETQVYENAKKKFKYGTINVFEYNQRKISYINSRILVVRNKYNLISKIELIRMLSEG